MLAKQRLQVGVRVLAFVLTATLVAIFGLTGGSASAEDRANAANTLKISPVRTDIEINPGESKIVETFLTNLTNTNVTVRPIANDFIAGDERGTPALILDVDEFAQTHSLKRFMGELSDVTIPANSSKKVELQITVPKDAQAGGYFGAIRFAPATPDSGGEVNLSASVASLILLTVPGEMIEKLELTEFAVLQGEKTGSLFQTPDNLEVTFRFENKGSVQIGPIGHISVQKGDKVVFTEKFNDQDPRDMILPDSARRWDVPLKNIDTFGHYKVSATFTYGKENKTIEVIRSFWVIPMSYIIGGIIGLIALIALIVGIVLFFRGYKRRILRNQRGGYRR